MKHDFWLKENVFFFFVAEIDERKKKTTDVTVYYKEFMLPQQVLFPLKQRVED